MLVKANISFAGKISMHKGQEIDLEENKVLRGLISCGYVSEVVSSISKKNNKPKSKAKKSNRGGIKNGNKQRQ